MKYRIATHAPAINPSFKACSESGNLRCANPSRPSTMHRIAQTVINEPRTTSVIRSHQSESLRLLRRARVALAINEGANQRIEIPRYVLKS